MKELEFIKWFDEKLADKEGLRQMTELEFEIEDRMPIAAVLVAADDHWLSHTTLMSFPGEVLDLNPAHDDLPSDIKSITYATVRVTVGHTYEDYKASHPFEHPSSWDWNGGMYGYLESCREECSHIRMLRY